MFSIKFINVYEHALRKYKTLIKMSRTETSASIVCADDSNKCSRK